MNLKNMITTLSTDTDTITLGQPIMLLFSVQNEDSKKQKFCKYMCPLEGFKGNILEVVDKAGNEINYKGINVKRGQPRKEDYVKLKANESESVIFDLTKSYEILKIGQYSIQFKGRESMNQLPDSNRLTITIVA